MASNQMNDSISTTTKNILLKSTTYADSMKFYPDIFDIIDYDDEMEHDMNEKQMWEKIREEYNLDYKFDNTYDNMQEKEDDHEEIIENTTVTGNNDDDDETCEEQVLSQRLSQLSTTVNDYEREPSIDGKRRRLPLPTTTKKFRTNMDDSEDNTDLMPEYLLSRNKLFDRMIEKIIHITSPMDMDDLRQIAFFIHQIAHFNKLHDLWSTYLQAGIGSLKDDKDEEEEEEEEDVSMQIDRRYWFNDVKSILQAKPNLSLPNMTEEEKHIACQDIVYQHLHEYREKIAMYEYQMNEKKKDSIYWTLTIEEAIQTFVQQYGIIPLQMKYNNKIGILTYEYKDQIFERQYQQQKPTAYQKQMAQDLYDIELQLETVKLKLIEYPERIRCNKPPRSYDCLEISLSSSINTISNNHRLRQQLLNRYEKLIQQTKTDLIAVHIAIEQANLSQYQTLFDEKKEQMSQNNEKHVSNKEMTKSLQYLINKRSLNMKNKFKFIYNFTINYYIRSSYSQLEMMRKNGNSCFLSNLIIDSTTTVIEHHLTNQQLQLLNRGPTYVVPGQLHILSSTSETIDNMIKKQYAPLKHQLAIIFDKYHTYTAYSMNFQTDTYKAFKDLYSIPLPNDVIYQRTIYEKKLIQSIRCFLEKNNFILRRTADQNNTFYLGHKNDFINLSNQYMENNTDTYHILFNMNEMNNIQQDVQEQLKKRYLFMNSELDKLFQEKKLNNIIHKRLQVKIENLKLPYLYFLPEISTTNSSLQVKPMISAHHSITSKLAQYLKQLIRPLIFPHMHKTIFINEADFIKKLLYYTNHEHHLHPTTLFATIKIMNFQTMASHESMIHRLGYFLFDHLITNRLHYTSLTTLNQSQSISIDTIKKLTELYLKNNLFYYNGKIYEFTKGGPNSLLFSEILSNIYLFTYEKFIFDDPKLKTELYGRYKDQMFFTWNQSKDELKLFLDNITEKYAHIQIETSFGTCVQFFNAQIENHNGHLYTCVYHHSPMSKYTLPYVIDHAKLNHSLWFRSALIRAIRFCSNFIDFNHEQISLVMACLIHGYSIDFIETQLKHFYLRFDAEKLRFCPNQTIYEQIRYRLFDFINVQRTISDKNQELEDKEYILQFSYPYDYGPYRQFNKIFHELWKKYFKDDSQLSHKDTKIILNTKHLYSLNTFLAQQKPSHELLKTSKKMTF